MTEFLVGYSCLVLGFILGSRWASGWHGKRNRELQAKLDELTQAYQNRYL